MSDDIIIQNDLPAHIVALDHSTLDAAMALCEQSHAVVIPSPLLDENGCRSGLVEANRIYSAINDLSKELDKRRLEEGRKITAVKARLDEVVAAAVKPLEDQRSKLGHRILLADRALHQVIAEKKRAAEAEARRVEAERQAAEALARRQEAQRVAAAAAAQAKGVDLPPDEVAPVAAPAPRLVDVEPAYIPPAPKSAVKSKTEYRLVVEDLSLVPDEVGGAGLWTLDEAACLRLLKVKIKIPGLRLEETESTSAKGRGGAFAVG